DLAGDDPRVYDRENEPGRPWQLTGVTLSVFLVHVAVFEAVWNAPFGAVAAWITADRLEKVLAPLTPIPGAAWRWPSPLHQLYVRPAAHSAHGHRGHVDATAGAVRPHGRVRGAVTALMYPEVGCLSVR
ncbi:MAG TPA: hypothetical protein VFB74_32920, partial [Kribbellaceae bacterium]|nr:hypothetical protein [Kribbellaceae bacterium]